MRQRPSGGKLEPMKGPVKALDLEYATPQPETRKKQPEAPLTFDDTIHAKKLRQKAGVTDINFDLSLNQDFIKTTEFFARGGAEEKKGQMPQPHVTLRKKEWQQALNEKDEMNQSHTSSFRQTQDPMAQTLQKWRESIAEDDS